MIRIENHPIGKPRVQEARLRRDAVEAHYLNTAMAAMQAETTKRYPIN
jgi:hypothetical protein